MKKIIEIIDLFKKFRQSGESYSKEDLLIESERISNVIYSTLPLEIIKGKIDGRDIRYVTLAWVYKELMSRRESLYIDKELYNFSKKCVVHIDASDKSGKKGFNNYSIHTLSSFLDLNYSLRENKDG